MGLSVFTIFLQAQSGGNTEDIWKWLASGLLAILGWIWGKKSGGSDTPPCSWEEERGELRLRIQQLEESNKHKHDHPEMHPLTNHINGVIGKFENKLTLMEERLQELKRR